MTADLDLRVRLHVYEEFLRSGRPPSAAETAKALAIARDDAEASYRRLEAARVIVLAPGTTSVWMANPLSAVPTPFRVEAQGRTYWGNCIWDALGIPAILSADAEITARCGDCGEALTVQMKDGTVQADEGVVHFAVPARRWWENIGFT